MKELSNNQTTKTIAVLLCFIGLSGKMTAQNCNANFTWTTTCNVVNFVPNTINPNATYNWNFGDGNTSNLSSPTHIYIVNSSGQSSFSVILSYSFENCIDTDTIPVTINVGALPNATIGSVGLDPAFVSCGPTTQNPNYTLMIGNLSTTQSTNQFYEINWGDGTPNFQNANFSSPISHPYTQVGLFNILVTVRGTNGCIERDTFEFFNGSNPGGNLGSLANTTNCVPAVVTWPIENTGNNPPGTTYRMWVTDNSNDTTVFQHPPPANFSHNFFVSSCDPMFTGNNGKFRVFFEASNPCQTNVSSIEVVMHRPPIADFSISPDSIICQEETLIFENESTPALYFSGTMCRDSMRTTWSITPNTGFSIVSGSLTSNTGFSARFSTPGTYQIRMIYDVAFNSIACLRDTVIKTICVLPIPNANFSAPGGLSGCAPLTLDGLLNQSNTLGSCGPATYLWEPVFSYTACGQGGMPTFIQPTNSGSVHPDILFSSPGVYALRLTTSNICGTRTFTDTVRVGDRPSLTISPIDTFCDVASIIPQLEIISTCNSSQAPTLTWSFPGGTPSTGSGQINTPIVFTNTSNQPQNYTITVSASNNCGPSQDTETFTIFPSPVISQASSNAPICVGGTLQLFSNSASPRIVYAWSGPNNFSSNQRNPVIPNVTIEASGTYRVVIRDTISNCADTSQVQVLVYNAPQFSIQPDTAKICFGQSGNLTASGNFTFNWSPATYLNVTTGPTVVVTPTQIGTILYSVTATDSNNCSGTESVVVNAVPLPTVSAGANAIACIGTNLQLIGSPPSGNGASGVWSGPFVNSSGLFNATQAGTYTVVYNFTDANNCSASDSAQVCVRAAPVPSFELSDATVCVNQPVSVINNSTIQNTCDTPTFAWTVEFIESNCHNTSNGWSFASGNSSSPSPAFQFSLPGRYEIILNIVNDCQSYEARRTITVGTAPQVSLADIGDTFCSEQTITPVAIVNNCESAVTSYAWVFNGGINLQTSSAQNPGAVSFGVGGHSIAVTVANACGQSTVIDSFTILPVANPMPILEDSVCASSSFTVINNSSQAVSYLWSISPASAAGISNPTSPAPTFTFNQVVGEHTINLTINNPPCPNIIRTFPVFVNRAPSAALQSIPDDCESATLTPVPTYNDAFIRTYQWSFPGALPPASSERNPTGIQYNAVGNYTVSLRVENECGADTVSRTFRLLESPMPGFVVRDSVCVGEPFSIVNNSTGDSLRYRWTVSPASNVNILNETTGNPQVTFNGAPGFYTLRVSVFNPVCDSIVQTFMVYVNKRPTVGLASIPDDCESATLTPVPTYNDAFIRTYQWSFPGAVPPASSERNPTGIQYNAVGNYTVSLRVENECGADTVSRSFRLLDGPELSFVVEDSVCVDVPFTVVNNSTGDELSYRWSVTPPAAANILDPTAGNPQITFSANAGVYTLRVLVFNPVCDTLTASFDVYVNLRPTVSIAEIEDACDLASLTPQPIYNLNSSFINFVHWSFPGGAPSSSDAYLPPQVSYSSPGAYTISVEVQNECGTASAMESFTVFETPTIDLGPSDTICLSDGVTALFPPSPPGGTWTGAGIVAPGNTGLFDPGAITLSGPVTEAVVTYTVTNGICPASRDKIVYVIDLRFVDGGPDVNVCISENTVQLTGGTPAGGWYVGQGVIDEAGIFSPLGLATGAYTITYFYQLPFTECIGSDTFIVNIRPLPAPDFSVTDSLCIDVPATYLNASQGASRYEWFFDDGATYASTNPSHAFSTTGDHTVQLIAYSIYNCADSISKMVYVSGPPEVSFAMDTTEGCAVLPITFDNQTIGYQFVRYNWNFGNNQFSNEEQPGTIFYEQGLRDTTYYIRLTATNHCGTSSQVDSILVFPLPLAAPRFSQVQGCTPLNVRFNNTTEGLPDSFAWYIDGVLYSTDSLPPDRLFYASGIENEIYEILFVAYNECGTDSAFQQITVLPDSIRTFFSVDVNAGCEPLTVSFQNSTSPDSLIIYNWYFDQNDDTSTARDTSYTFYATGDTITRYTVTLVADNGCSQNSYSIEITVYPSPRVGFDAPLYSCAEDSVSFLNTSIDVNGNFWEFGDGSTSTATNPVHFFEAPGSYWVKLTAYSAATGCPASDSMLINIRSLPQPILAASPRFGCPPLDVTLVNQTLNPQDYFFRWDFGDGNTTVGANPPSHRYLNSGNYNITLWAVDVYGCDKDTVFQSILVYPVPVPQFEIIQEAPCGLPQEVCFDNTSTGAFGFTWNLGNGTPVTTQNEPCTSYSIAGPYTIELTASNEFLCAATLSKEFRAYDVPMADFTVPDTDICEGDTVQFTNTSQHTEFVRWEIREGLNQIYTDTVRSLRYWFRDQGVYGVTLIAGNGSGCVDTLVLDDYFTVFPTPVAGFTAEMLDDELPTTYQFWDESSPDAIEFGWYFSDGTPISRDKDPIHRFLSSFDKTVFHWAINEFGCADTISRIVELDTLGGLYIPNLMEPANPEFEKQVFMPKGIGLSDYYISVFTRTGQLVWESSALNEEGIPEEFWDGTFLGKPMPAGVYVWKVGKARFFGGKTWTGMKDFKGKPRKTGFLYLVR